VKRIFGPVPSRRLGRSLGIDVIPYKTCTFDCVYCECGGTTDKTCTRREFYELDDILDELENRLAEMPEKPDIVTLSGAGEPTLYLRTGELIESIKRTCELPVAVITNSSLLARRDVRDELLPADVVLPSLDAASDSVFQRINRPHEDCMLEAIIDGLERFTSRFEGTVLLEILLVEGFNTDEKDLLALREALERMRIDSIQLNTAVRPGTEKEIAPLDRKSLEAVRGFFGSRCEIVADTVVSASREDQAAEEKIISLLKRRPCTAEDIHRSLGIPLPGVVKILTILSRDGSIIMETKGRKAFYTAANRDSS
jgi:wyosine [tRNA(Phe)-imidazoG37] synthetase (radical SAM superfamily)